MYDSFLVSVTTLLSQATPPAGPSFGELLFRMLPMMAMVFFVFYFLVIRPQNAKLLAQEKLLNDLKKGDNILTSGGIMGRVAGVESDHILVEIAANTRVKFERSKIVKRIEKSEPQKQAA